LKNYFQINVFIVSFFIICIFTAVYNQIFSQTADYSFVRSNNIVVKDSNGVIFKFPWAGGLSNCQFSNIDFNLDGIKDLLVFDKIGNILLCFLNSGISDSLSYIYAPEYVSAFPKIKSWIQLLDYNNDGKEDIFTYSNGGIKVYKNTSINTLTFSLVKENISSSYNGSNTNIFCLSEDYPAIADIDGDGDMDILNFWVLGKFVNYHKNLSVENYGIPDSLDFQLADNSWGCFAEDESSNVLILDSCMNGFKNAISKNFKHSGSTLLASDFNGDGLKDVIIGDVDYANLIKLTNGGSLTKAKITSQDSLFPILSKPVRLFSFPVANLIDVNNDGKKDLLVSPFDPGLTTAESYKSNWLYLNTGVNNFPVYNFRQDDFLQKDMLDFGTGAYPVLFDIDNDGLTDLFVGNIGYRDTSYLQNGILTSKFISKIAYFKNEGSVTNPVFRLKNRDFANVSSLNIQAAYPAFGDINNDGKTEMIVGNSDGKLYLFENISTSGNPDFILTQSNYQNIDVGDFSTPQLFDLNKDGLLDLIIGERQNFWKDAYNNIIARKGNLNYYKNTGTADVPVFSLITDSLGGVDVTNYSLSNYGYSTPCFFRTNAGETRLFAGNEEAKIYYYKNIDNNLNGNFIFSDTLTFVEGTLKLQINEGTRSGIAVSDLNNDGYLDVLIGNAAGGITFYKGCPLNTNVEKLPNTVLIDFNIYPNPANNEITIETKNIADGNYIALDIYNIYGEKVKKIEKVYNNQLKINISFLKRGIYFCELSNKNNNSEIKISKKLIIIN